MAYRGIGTVDGDDEYDACDDEEQKSDGEQKREATLIAKPFAKQALVPCPMPYFFPGLLKFQLFYAKLSLLLTRRNSDLLKQLLQEV